MKCPKCNQEIEDNSVFCEYCGEKILTVENELEKNVENVTADNVAKPWYKRKWVLPVGIALAVAIVAVVVLNTNYVKAHWFHNADSWRELAEKHYYKGYYEKADWEYEMAMICGDYYSAMILAGANLGPNKYGWNRPDMSDYLRNTRSEWPDYRLGIEYLKRAYERRPAYAVPYAWLGDIYYGDYSQGMRDIAKAVFYYEKAIEMTQRGDDQSQSRIDEWQERLKELNDIWEHRNYSSIENDEMAAEEVAE